MSRHGPRLPARVTLPSAPMMPAWHVRDALGASKQVLHLWRVRSGFPSFIRDGRDYLTSTDAIADWLRAKGVEVVR